MNNDGLFVVGLVVERPFECVVEKLFHLIAAREKLVPVVALHLLVIVVRQDIHEEILERFVNAILLLIDIDEEVLAGERIVGEVLQLEVERAKEVDVELRATRERLLTRADQLEEAFPLLEPIVEMSEKEDDEAQLQFAQQSVDIRVEPIGSHGFEIRCSVQFRLGQGRARVQGRLRANDGESKGELRIDRHLWQP